MRPSPRVFSLAAILTLAAIAGAGPRAWASPWAVSVPAISAAPSLEEAGAQARRLLSEDRRRYRIPSGGSVSLEDPYGGPIALTLGEEGRLRVQQEGRRLELSFPRGRRLELLASETARLEVRDGAPARIEFRDRRAELLIRVPDGGTLSVEQRWRRHLLLLGPQGEVFLDIRMPPGSRFRVDAP